VTAPIILWFRNDLRLSDHPALTAAAETDAPILPLYILDDETPGRLCMGGASRWWLHGSLASLAKDLKQRGGELCLRRGKAGGGHRGAARRDRRLRSSRHARL
jgi:deoxyribodipyrimidine photo-lyase